MPRLALIPARRADAELRAAYRYVNSRWGLLGAPPVSIKITQAFSHRPALLRAVADGYFFAGWCGQLPRSVREVVAVLVSRENECFYCLTAHVSFLQAVGMPARRVEDMARDRLASGALEPYERAIEELVEKSAHAAARLRPDDVVPLARLVGRAAAIEIVVMMCAFHFINRVANMVGLRSDLPLVRRLTSRVWTAGVRLQASAMRCVLNLKNRTAPPVDLEATWPLFTALRGRPPAPGYAALQEAPATAGFLASTVSVRPQLPAATLERISRAVAAALPQAPGDTTGLHARPADPLEALAFVGTRYSARVTDEMVEAVRRAEGWSDAQLTDAFYAIGMFNCFERMDRLFAEALPEITEPRGAALVLA